MEYSAVEMQRRTVSIIEQIAEELFDAGLPRPIVSSLERLVDKVEQPCLVAVVGRVKAGKSTFVNALLGEDLAKVSGMEATTTINHFRHGRPADPKNPYRCFWRDDQRTPSNVDRVFVDRIQGTDPEALRLASEVHHIEYRLASPHLEGVTIVDTPGTGAAVAEHQAVAEEFLGLRQELSVWQEEQTQAYERQADAIIYLVGHVARADDQSMLDEFRHAAGNRARAINSVGVMSKIDLLPEVFARRDALAAKIAAQLQKSLNVVVPVSAGLEYELHRLLAANARGLSNLADTLRQIPYQTLQRLLRSDELFCESEPKDCPVSPRQREQLQEGLPWTVFTTIATVAGDPSVPVDDVPTRLRELAGFTPLRQVLDRRFVRRRAFLRCYGVANDVRRIMESIRYTHLPAARAKAREDVARRNRFIAFLNRVDTDQQTAQELAEYVIEQLSPRANLDAMYNQQERLLDDLLHTLDAHNADADSLDDVESQAAEFSDDEIDELRGLLGLRGFSPQERLPEGCCTSDYVSSRYLYWNEQQRIFRRPHRASVATQATYRYSALLSELMN